MRYYVIVRGPDDAPWVVCETPDDAIADELAGTFIDAVVLPRNEALLDPDFSGAAERWERADDSVWQRVRTEADAYEVIEEAWEAYRESIGDIGAGDD